MAPAGNLSLVDTVARGELQFFVPGLSLDLLACRGVEEVARRAGRHLPLAARVFSPRRERPDRSSVAEVAPGRGARGGVVLSHSSLDWQRRLDPKDGGCLYFVDGTVLLRSRYPQRDW